eukprot:TRINITY_DN55926_c0_g1_i1.p1 TRINITY_DN55926_c0_g1~~TRINITY_DN55926_c0_g1_i1.p1  ORF type:complete len:509 (-),score=72.48 TRINITY_DN55926_c0_g1_i1:176-1702(-)
MTLAGQRKTGALCSRPSFEKTSNKSNHECTWSRAFWNLGVWSGKACCSWSRSSTIRKQALNATNTPGATSGHDNCRRKDDTTWGLWTVQEEKGPGATSDNVWQNGHELVNTSSCQLHQVHLCVGGQDVRGSFRSQTAAVDFQRRALFSLLGWPRQPIDEEPCRSPTWDHPKEFESAKEYSFREAFSKLHEQTVENCAEGKKIICSRKKRKTVEFVRSTALSPEELQRYDEDGFVIGVPIIEGNELENIRRQFNELLSTRTDGAPSDDAKFRSAHTLTRPLHQAVVARLAKHERVLAVVEDILGPRFVCWSAHLFCKLPGDPTEQPWHQDAGFWPLSQSRALTLWLAMDDVDDENASVSFIKGSHRLGRLPWRQTNAVHHLLTQQIPDVDLLGRCVPVRMRAGEASVHSDLTVHGSAGNKSCRRRAGLALRFVGADAECLGPMINGYKMNGGCILPKGAASDPKGHWRALRRRPGGTRPNLRFRCAAREGSSNAPVVADVVEHDSEIKA